MPSALSIDASDKIAVNGCDLLNRYELSSYQDRELQRYIDQNAHILSFKDREKPAPPKSKPKSNYKEFSRNLNTGESPQTGYTKLDSYFPPKRNTDNSEYQSVARQTRDPAHLSSPTGQRINLTSDFAELGDGSKLDDGFAVQYKPDNYASTPGSGYRVGYPTDYGSGTNQAIQNGYDSCAGSGAIGKGGVTKSLSNVPASPYGSLKRKGVSWLDQERARSLSPPHNSTQREMSQFGSTGNLNSFRDRTTSPAYSALGRHKDDYNRFETARHAQSKQQAKDKTEESRFSGYGDRPGSGVELAGHHWHGGEIITNPQNVPKSLKPRRFYYSPIGDGTVAADGVELKRRPVDLSPRVTITQVQHVDRGQKGQDGVNVYEKNWSNTMGSMPASEGYGSEGGYGPGSGRNSRTGALSPGGGDFYGKGPSGGPTTGSGGPGGVGGGGPGSGLGGPSGPGSGNGGYGSGRGTPAGFGSGGDPYGSGRPGSGLGRDPYSTLDSRSGNPYGSNGNLGPGNDGRMSVASSVFSDPSYRFDTKTGYLITNPRELIHQYATTTPIAVMDTNDHTPTTTTVTKQSLYRKTEETTEERFAPYAPYKSASNVQSPNKFVRQLRDDTMTHTQREANTHQDPLNQRDNYSEQKISEIRNKAYSTKGNHDEIDSLTQQLIHGLQSGHPTPTRY